MVLLQAFGELSTDRARSLTQAGQLVGPIPWTAIKAYSRHLRLDHSNTEWFMAAMRALDTEYLKMERERITAEIDSASPSGTGR